MIKKITIAACALMFGVMLTGCQREIVQQVPAPQQQRPVRPIIVVPPAAPAQPCPPPRPNINIEINPRKPHCR